MNLEARAEELQEKIKLMNRCYLSGFVSRLLEIHLGTAFCRGLVNGGEDYKFGVITNLELLESYYDKIPFEEIGGNSDFKELFEVKSLLPEFRREICAFLENPSDALYDKINGVKYKIGRLGVGFKPRFIAYLDELRKIPGYEDYSAPIVHNLLENGKEYGF